MKPDYSNCHLNLISSIEKRFGYNHEFESNKKIDELIKDKKHVFLILLDGMGNKIIEDNLKESSFIRSHKISTMCSIFPPTTACDTNVVISGKLPNETGWFAWHQYFKDYDKDIIGFRNVDYYSGEDVDFNAYDIIPADPFYLKYRDKGIDVHRLFPPFDPEGFKSFKAQCDEMIKISKTDKESYTYCYWTEPDFTVHMTGCHSLASKMVLRNLDRKLKYLSKNIGNDSAFIVIADHGLVDSKVLHIKDYPDIDCLLTKKPTLEYRVISFEVSDKDKFKEVFNNHFGSWFELYTKEEFLNSDYFYKTKENKVSDFLFDFVAVATGEYSLCYDEKLPLKALHAGSMEDEMIVPIVVFRK